MISKFIFQVSLTKQQTEAGKRFVLNERRNWYINDDIPFFFISCVQYSDILSWSRIYRCIYLWINIFKHVIIILVIIFANLTFQNYENNHITNSFIRIKKFWKHACLYIKLLQTFIVKKKQSFLCIPILKEIIIINLFVYILSKVQFKRYREIDIHISY